MTDFDDLQQRVEAAGGTLTVDDTGDWYEFEYGSVPDVTMRIFRLGPGLEMLKAMYDGLEAKARARRLIVKWGSHAAVQHAHKGSASAHRKCITELRREFGIEGGE